ncbi:MAG: hypothetical protein WBE48_08340, partial [Xanthobacteraceae bacterium]
MSAIMSGDSQIDDLARLDLRPEQHSGELLGMAGIVRFHPDAARRAYFTIKMPRQRRGAALAQPR